MYEITHQKARALIQVAVDFVLESADQSALDVHLSECRECPMLGQADCQDFDIDDFIAAVEIDG